MTPKRTAQKSEVRMERLRNGGGGRDALGTFLGGQGALGPFRVVELTFEIVVRCFEPLHLFGGICIATDGRIAAHLLDRHRTLILMLETRIECLSLIWKRMRRRSFGNFRVPRLNYSFDRNFVIDWFVARSVMLDPVLPSLLPFDVLWPSLLQEGFSVPEILTEVFLGNEYGELVENFNHVVERKRAFYLAAYSWKIEELINKTILQLHQASYQNLLKSCFEGSLLTESSSDIAGK